ncbi:MAG: hypothetical protein KF745_11080 [Phycisphaeraceae bacterium]|nr:hypothetical protein [Phycisphaeraceae bacterium]
MQIAERSLRSLLTGLIDYAGLFPPAKLPMKAAVDAYAKHLTADHAWMLGRFICPVSRFEEFRQAATPHLSRDMTGAVPPWRVSALIDGDLNENMDAIFAFNSEHSDPDRGLAVVDAAELKLPAKANADEIDTILDSFPDDIFPFFEIAASPGHDFRGQIAALAGAGAGAKIRTGGLTPDAFPSPELVAQFIIACDAADVPFKATAGLHHPVRAEHNLTYEPGCPRGVMHGFLNVFMAACFARSASVPHTEIESILAETDPSRFRFSDTSAAWRNRQIDATEIEGIRDSFALSFGSCSFDEPVEDLGKLGLL